MYNEWVCFEWNPGRTLNKYKKEVSRGLSTQNFWMDAFYISPVDTVGNPQRSWSTRNCPETNPWSGGAGDLLQRWVVRGRESFYQQGDLAGGWSPSECAAINSWEKWSNAWLRIMLVNNFSWLCLQLSIVPSWAQNRCVWDMVSINHGQFAGWFHANIMLLFQLLGSYPKEIQRYLTDQVRPRIDEQSCPLRRCCWQEPALTHDFSVPPAAI